MKTWSYPPNNNFKIKYFLDTNILFRLIDRRYESYNIVLDYFRNNKFCNVFTSSYVIFELIEIRKRELFFRQVLDSMNSKGNLNLSLLFSSRHSSVIDDIKYSDYSEKIFNDVKNELTFIFDEMGIIAEENKLHQELLAPTYEIALNTHISREDSLVLVIPIASTNNS